MVDAMTESNEDKVRRLEKQNETLRAYVETYKAALTVLRPLVYQTKKLADRAVKAIAEAGLPPFDEREVYRGE